MIFRWFCVIAMRNMVWLFESVWRNASFRFFSTRLSGCMELEELVVYASCSDLILSSMVSTIFKFSTLFLQARCSGDESLVALIKRVMGVFSMSMWTRVSKPYLHAMSKAVRPNKSSSSYLSVVCELHMVVTASMLFRLVAWCSDEKPCSSCKLKSAPYLTSKSKVSRNCFFFSLKATKISFFVVVFLWKSSLKVYWPRRFMNYRNFCFLKKLGVKI